MAFALTANRRAVFRKGTKSLRRNQRIPAVLYGHGISSQPLDVDALAFQRVYAKAKESSLVDLTVDSQPAVKVIIQAAQVHPLHGRYLHIDFHQVSMTEKLETEIPFAFVGESLAVKELGGILVKSMDKVKVSCLPGDLVQSIDIDLSKLKTFEDAVHLRDIAAPKGIVFLASEDEVVATVEAPRSEAELKALEEQVVENVEDVEVVKKEKTDEVPEEGAEAAAPEADKQAEKKSAVAKE